MFTTARQTSQGSQRQYMTSTVDNVNFGRRDGWGLPNTDFNIDHELSPFADTPYLTLQTTAVMRNISRPIDNDDLSILTQEIN